MIHRLIISMLFCVFFAGSSLAQAPAPRQPEGSAPQIESPLKITLPAGWSRHDQPADQLSAGIVATTVLKQDQTEATIVVVLYPTEVRTVKEVVENAHLKYAASGAEVKEPVFAADGFSASFEVTTTKKDGSIVHGRLRALVLKKTPQMSVLMVGTWSADDAAAPADFETVSGSVESAPSK